MYNVTSHLLTHLKLLLIFYFDLPAEALSGEKWILFNFLHLRFFVVIALDFPVSVSLFIRLMV